MKLKYVAGGNRSSRRERSDWAHRQQGLFFFIYIQCIYPLVLALEICDVYFLITHVKADKGL